MVDLRTKDEMIAQQERERRIMRRGFKQPAAKDKQVGGEHYKNMGVEVWDVVDTWMIDQRIGYYRGNALKYTMRMGSKDASAQEIEKAIHYLEKLLEVIKEKQNG